MGGFGDDAILQSVHCQCLRGKSADEKQTAATTATTATEQKAIAGGALENKSRPNGGLTFSFFWGCANLQRAAVHAVPWNFLEEPPQRTLDCLEPNDKNPLDLALFAHSFATALGTRRRGSC